MSEPPIVYFGNEWFADNRTSSHHVARQLAQRTELLYVECPGLRAPEARGRDVARAVRKLARAFHAPLSLSGGPYLKTLVQFPAHGSRMVNAINRRWSRATIRRSLRTLGADRPLVWCTVPHVAHFVGDLDARGIIYHCIDDYAALPGVDAVAVRAMDDALAHRADLVVAASQPVYDSRRAINPNTVLMPHGVDYEHFARARRRDQSRPPELQAITGPIVGFTGLIERWIDVDLVGWLASELPHATFVMIGRIAVPSQDVPQRANLLWLGPKPYERLPQFGAHFDLAIIPYHRNAQVHAANPLKLREYLAMGLPVVSVDTPEIAKFSDVVSIVGSREAFRDAIVASLGDADGHAAERRQAAARAGTWSARIDGLWPHVREVLDRTAGGAR